MSIIPLEIGSPAAQKVSPISPASDRCLLRLVSAELALHEALEVVRKTEGLSAKQDILELITTAIRTNRAACERYMAAAYPARGLARSA